MSILGTGIDIVEIGRLKKRTNLASLARKILTDYELEQYRQKGRGSVAYLAKRFAAKEAVSKAFKTGIGKVGLHNIEVRNDDNGAPEIKLYNDAIVVAEQLAQERPYAIALSLSDEKNYAVAQAIIFLQ